MQMLAGQVSEQWINAKELAVITGLSLRALRKRVYNDWYEEIRYVDGNGQGGKTIQIGVSCLPAEIQAMIKVKGETVQSADEAYHKVSEAERAVAMERLAVLKDWQQTCREWVGVSKADVLPMFLKRHGISRATLYKWDKDYRDNGVTGLLPSENKMGKRGSYKMIPEAYDYLMALYLNNKKRSVAYCYRLLEAKAEVEGWTLPDLRTVQRIIADLPEAVKMAARETSKTVYDKCLPYTQRDNSTVLANQVWVGDHFRCDFFVKGKNGKWVRPWLTAWLDMRSRKFVSWMVCENPSSSTIIASFAKAALDPAIGLPKEIYIDNGRDYCSKEFAGTGHRTRKSAADADKVKTMLESLQVDVHFALPANGRAKVIEREFRVVAEEICREFPTWCASKKEDRPENLQKLLKKDLPHMTVTLEDAAQIMGDYFKFIKNKRVTNGKGRAGEYPDQTFEKYRMPYRAAGRDVMKLLLTRHSQPLVVRNGQITFKKKAYFAEELVLRYGEKVYIRYNEDAMDSVSVWSLEDRYICDARTPQELPGVGADTEMLSVEQHRKGRIKKSLYENELLQVARSTQTMDIKEIINVYKERAVGTVEPKRPDVISPLIAVGQNMLPEKPKPNKYENVLKFLK
jgi:putative transposase